MSTFWCLASTVYDDIIITLSLYPMTINNHDIKITVDTSEQASFKMKLNLCFKSLCLYYVYSEYNNMIVRFS